MASIYFLMHDIRTCLLDAFEHMPFREPVEKGQPATRGGEKRYRIPRVYIGDLPAKRRSGADPATGAESGEDYPALIIRAIDGETKADGSGCAAVDAVNIGILCMVYNPGAAEAGIRDVLDMVERVKFMLATRDTWADGMWREILPIKWYAGLDRRLSLYDAGKQDEARYYGGAVETQFIAAGPAVPPDAKILEVL